MVDGFRLVRGGQSGPVVLKEMFTLLCDFYRIVHGFSLVRGGQSCPVVLKEVFTLIIISYQVA